MGNWNDGSWYGAMGGWMGGWMWLPAVFMMALLILGSVALIRSLSAGSSRETETPLAVAARRLARGEITTEEYNTLRSTLGG